MSESRPTVLCFSGHDPSGGAGIQADIETLVSHHCHACTVITALTEQDSHNARKLIAQQAQDFMAQAQCLLADIAIDAIKIGMIGSSAIALVIAELVLSQPDIPVVYDPVLAAGGGADFTDDKLVEIIKNTILPLVTIVTPNSIEAGQLTGHQAPENCAQSLLELGCQSVLITGGHQVGDEVCNQLYHQQGVETFYWPRLAGEFHGSGCTLASSIAAGLAHGLSVITAVTEAQEYTSKALAAAYRIGKGQSNPDRLFWLQDE